MVCFQSIQKSWWFGKTTLKINATGSSFQLCNDHLLYVVGFLSHPLLLSLITKSSVYLPYQNQFPPHVSCWFSHCSLHLLSHICIIVSKQTYCYIVFHNFMVRQSFSHIWQCHVGVYCKYIPICIRWFVLILLCVGLLIEFVKSNILSVNTCNTIPTYNS